MSFNFKMPQINGTDPSVQISSIQTYLYQLVEQLNHSLNILDSNITETSEKVIASEVTNKEKKEQNAQASFDSIKGLIIKSAEIVNAYYEKMKLRFDGLYTAQSTFGAYVEQTDTAIELANNGIAVNTSSISAINTELTTIEGDIDTLESGVSGLGTRMQTAESNITTNANAITTKVAQTTYNTDMAAVNTAIQSKASASDLTALTGRVSSAESSITQQAGQIALKVNETDYNANNIVSKINSSALTINGSNVNITSSDIHLEGYTTINSGFSIDASGNMTANNGTFTGNVYLAGDDSKLLIGDDGVLNHLQFTTAPLTSGIWNVGWTELQSSGQMLENYLTLNAYIPSNFEVSQAYLTLEHRPLYCLSGAWYQGWTPYQFTNQRQWARGLALFNNTASGAVEYVEGSDYAQMGTVKGTEITAAFGASGWTPSNTNIEIHSSSNIASSLTSGQMNKFVIGTRESAPAMSTTLNGYLTNVFSKCGIVNAYLDVFGYAVSN